MNPKLRLCVVLCIALAAGARAAEPPGQTDYLDGLDALEAGRAEAAVTAFSRAIEADEENPDYYAARGTAQVLAESPPDAIRDLERSLRLRSEHRETKMWLACAVAMTGDFGRDTNYFPAATRDPYESYARDGSREYGELAFRQQLGDVDERAKTMRETGRRKLRESVAAFAQRVKARPELSAALAARGRAKAEAGRPADALADLDRALAADPENPDALLLHASGLLDLGAAAPARAELTRALTFRTGFGPAYAARARAAARMGDLQRAHLDLEIAGRYSADVEAARAAVDAEPGAPTEANEALLPALQAAAGSGVAPEALVTQALALARAVDGRRLRHDEWYQNRLRELEEAASTQQPDGLANLGRFLLEERSVRRERVEPRAAWLSYRWQTEAGQQRDLERAGQLAEQALAAAPEHVPSLALKARVSMSRGLYGDAEGTLRRALELAPADPEVLGLIADVAEVAAAQKSAEAGNLRTPKYLGSHEETVGDWVYTYTRWSYPSQGDLAQADELDQQSQKLIEWALEQVRLASEVAQGTALGHYYAGVYHWKQGQLEDALASYDQAVRLDPSRVDWHFNRAGLLTALGRTAEALEARVQGTLLVQTTAAPLLELVWEHVARTRWRSASEALTRAAAVDPADARVSAYQGVVAQAAGKPADAIAAYRAALALEEARLRRSGRSLESNSSGALAPDDYGLSLAVRTRLGKLLQEAGRTQEALEAFEPGTRLEARVPRDTYATEVPSAQLPDPDLDPTVVPEADNALSLLARMRVGTGSALQALGRNDEALETLAPVAGLETLLVNGYGADKLRRSTIEAAVVQTRAALAKGDFFAAERFVEGLPRQRLGMGPSLSPYADLEAVGTELREEVDRRKQERLERGDESRDDGMPADEEKVAATLRRIGPAIGHPEMGNGMRRYDGDGREVELCIQVEQVVRFIVEPKSTRWRGQIVQGLQMLEASRSEQADLLEQMRARQQASGGQEDPRLRRGDPVGDLEARQQRFGVAAGELRKLALEAGFPSEELPQMAPPAGAELEAGPREPGPREPRPGPEPGMPRQEREPESGPGAPAASEAGEEAGSAEAAFAQIAAELGLPAAQSMGRGGSGFENVLSMAVRRVVEALFQPGPPEQRTQSLHYALRPLTQLRDRQQQQAERVKRQLVQTRQMEQRQGRASGSVERLEQQQAEAEKAVQAVDTAFARLRVLALGRGVSTADFDVAAGR